MRVLILGASGMLGHKLWQVFQDRFETWATVRSSCDEYSRFALFHPERLLGGVDALDFYTVVRAFETVKPIAVVNAVGVIKHLPAARDPVLSLTINSLFPRRLAKLCAATSARLIHISTDCVFSGRKGMCPEEDVPDPQDLYDCSKVLGEVDGSKCLSLRTSFVGRELDTAHGLVEWFLSNRGGIVRGYTNAIFSGFPTLILADIIADVIEQHPELSGVYHVSSDAISKYQLLYLLRDAYQVPIEIEPYPDVTVDRSLDSSRFRATTRYVPPPWPEMVEKLALDRTPYGAWRQARDS